MVHSKRFYSIVAIGLLFVFALASYVIKGIQQTALWIAIPGAALCAFLAYNKQKTSVCFKIQLVLYLWVAFSALFAFDLGLAGAQLKRIVACVLMIYVICKFANNKKTIVWLYLVYLTLYIGMVYYARTNIISNTYDYTTDRLDDNVLNANMMAYFTFFSTFIVFILGEVLVNKKIRLFFRLLFLLSPLWSFVIALLTASRQVLLIQVPLILCLFYLRYMINRSTFQRVFFVIVSISLIVLFVSKGVDVYESSQLSQRNELNLDDDIRMVYIRSAIQTGLDHPIVGVGPGCYGIYARNAYTFSHNNYTELFANCGFPALVLCVWLYCKFIKTQWKRYKRTKDNVFLVFLVFGIAYFVDNMFYVFYTAPWLMAFFFLVERHGENYYELQYKTGS